MPSFLSSPSRVAVLLSFLLLTPSCGDGGSGTGGSGGSTSSTGGSTGGTGGSTGGSTSGTGGSTGGSGTGGSATGGSATGGSATGGSATGGSATGGTGTGGSATGGSASTGTGGAMFDFYGATSSCDPIATADILSPDPAIQQDILDFTGEPAFDPMYLSPGGQEMWAAGNLNASSLKSEIFAYEALLQCNDAVFLKGEADIVYSIDGKKTDLLVELDGMKVGVSVVRAMSFPKGSPYPVATAFGVLDGKLADILQSTANVAPEDAWEKQILAVVAQTPEHAAAIETAWGMVDASHKADTIVIVTTTEGDDDFIYYNP